MIDSYAGRPVLVTGGAGFIGSHLVETLIEHGAEVLTVVDSLSTGRLSNLSAVASQIQIEKIDIVREDVGPILRAGDFDTVFHLAGNAHVNNSVDDPRMDMEKNVLGTFKLLESIREHSPATRVVFTSSATVYGEGLRTPIFEDDPKSPESPYGVSKLTCEHYVRLFASLYGLRTATARLFSVYGPRLRKQAVYDFMCKIHRDSSELFLHGDGTQVRDMNHVSNVVHALLTISRKARLEGESYNVAAGDPVNIRDLAERLCEAMGVTPRMVFSGKVRPGETQKWYPDHTRLLDLGYSNRVSLAEGLKDTVEWFHRDEAPTLS
jgi:UDP-glucose 4-epimerase